MNSKSSFLSSFFSHCFSILKQLLLVSTRIDTVLILPCRYLNYHASEIARSEADSVLRVLFFLAAMPPDGSYAKVSKLINKRLRNYDKNVRPNDTGN